MRSGVTGLRTLSALRGALGIAELALPGALLGAVDGAPASPGAVTVVRVLGARQLAQAAVCGAVPTSTTAALGAAVDAAHAASMVGWALAARHRRRGATVEAIAAAGLCLAGLLCRRAMRCPGSPADGGL